jgi:hypothetical protein
MTADETGKTAQSTAPTAAATATSASAAPAKDAKPKAKQSEKVCKTFYIFATGLLYSGYVPALVSVM